VIGLFSMFGNLVEIRWIGLQYAKVQEWKGCVVKNQSPRFHNKTWVCQRLPKMAIDLNLVTGNFRD
jgi:hypothetical protein